MNRNVGPSFTLSVLVVVFFAVVLFEPETPAPGVKTAAKSAVSPRVATRQASASPSVGGGRDQAPRPAMREGIDSPIVLTASRQGDIERTRVAPAGERPENFMAIEPGTVVPNAVARRVAAPTAAAPREDFTTVRGGESLGDVAERVYGSRLEMNALWLANRDLLDRKDTPLRAGTTLRTP